MSTLRAPSPSNRSRAGPEADEDWLRALPSHPEQQLECAVKLIVRAYNQNVSNYEAQISALRTQVQQAHEQNSIMEQRCHTFDQELHQERLRNQELRDDRERLESEVAELHTHVRKLEREIAQLQRIRQSVAQSLNISSQRGGTEPGLENTDSENVPVLSDRLLQWDASTMLRDKREPSTHGQQRYQPDMQTPQRTNVSFSNGSQSQHVNSSYMQPRAHTSLVDESQVERRPNIHSQYSTTGNNAAGASYQESIPQSSNGFARGQHLRSNAEELISLINQSLTNTNSILNATPSLTTATHVTHGTDLEEVRHPLSRSAAHSAGMPPPAPRRNSFGADGGNALQSTGLPGNGTESSVMKSASLQTGPSLSSMSRVQGGFDIDLGRTSDRPEPAQMKSENEHSVDAAVHPNLASEAKATAEQEGQQFFAAARERLSTEQFASFLRIVRGVNRREISTEDCISQCKDAFGSENADLLIPFQRLLSHRQSLSA